MLRGFQQGDELVTGGGNPCRLGFAPGLIVASGRAHKGRLRHLHVTDHIGARVAIANPILEILNHLCEWQPSATQKRERAPLGIGEQPDGERAPCTSMVGVTANGRQDPLVPRRKVDRRLKMDELGKVVGCKREMLRCDGRIHVEWLHARFVAQQQEAR